jgi:hypothetical protein
MVISLQKTSSLSGKLFCSLSVFVHRQRERVARNKRIEQSNLKQNWQLAGMKYAQSAIKSRVLRHLNPHSSSSKRCSNTSPKATLGVITPAALGNFFSSKARAAPIRTSS